MAPAGVIVFVRRGVDLAVCEYATSPFPNLPDKAGVLEAVAADEDPSETARRGVQTQLGASVDRVVRRGHPRPVNGVELVPVLLELADTSLDLAHEVEAVDWASPDELVTLGDGTWWSYYQAVAPTVRSIAADTDHGSTYLALRALEVLRDRATVLESDDADGEELRALARELKSVRPSMTALKVHVARVMDDGSSPASVRKAANAELSGAHATPRDVADTVTDKLNNLDTIATFSRSETVRYALGEVAPTRVLTTPARPGGEGIEMAETLAEHSRVALHADADLVRLVTAAEAVLLGADAIEADGTVHNKVGTHALAVVADRFGVPVYVASDTAKVCPSGSTPGEVIDRTALYDGDAPLNVPTTRFESTHADLIDGYLTEAGELDTDAIATIADRHAEILAEL